MESLHFSIVLQCPQSIITLFRSAKQATTADASKAALAAKVKVKPKLTSPQLNDLYRRLDINGDGELDLVRNSSW